MNLLLTGFEIRTGEDLFLVLVLGLVLLAGLVLLGVSAYLALLLRQLTTPVGGKATAETHPRTFWQRLWGLHPLEQEKALVLEHSYDGIQELDNPTPAWFMSLFYGTIGIGIVYMVYYHVLRDDSVMLTEYTQEVAVAEKARQAYLAKFANSVNESNVKVLTDVASLKAGETLFAQNCAACHGPQAQGTVGPNLTDDYWLHGGTAKSVFHTITEGVPEKGMISWKKTLNPLQIQQLTSFIFKLHGTNPPNPKEPQGEKVAAK
jgi:cytochrome c oxidase cbb3-type subunit 3